MKFHIFFLPLVRQGQCLATWEMLIFLQSCLHIKILSSPPGPFLILNSHQMFKEGVEDVSAHVLLISAYVNLKKINFRDKRRSMAHITEMNQTRTVPLSS